MHLSTSNTTSMSALDEKISSARTVFARGAGTWTGPETMPPAPWMPDGLEAVGRTEGREILGGAGLASDYRQEVNGEVSMTAHTVFVLDPETGRVHMHFFNQGPRPMEMVGEASGHVLTVEGDGPGGPMRQTFEYDEDEMKVTSEGKGPDGDWTLFFSGTYVRP